MTRKYESFFKARLMMRSDSIASPNSPLIQGFLEQKESSSQGHVPKPVQVLFLFAPTGQPVSLVVGVELSETSEFYNIENLIFPMLSF